MLATAGMVVGFWVQDVVLRQSLARVSDRVDAAVAVALEERARVCEALEAEVAQRRSARVQGQGGEARSRV